jgi:deglycase
MARELRGKWIAILASDGVERLEVEQPAGRRTAQAPLVSCSPSIQARQFDIVSAGRFPVDRAVSDALEDYDWLCCTGGN